MKKVKAPPGAKRLIESLRNLGYDCSTAVADLLDNSVAANASVVYVEILAQHGSRPPYIVIADDGTGMDREGLQEAMRFGSFQEYTPEDLGKYGLGLKTASLSQCRKLTVASKPRAKNGSRPRRHYARWDLDFVHGTDEWDLLLPVTEELKDWEAEALQHEASAAGGTVVLWSGLEEALPLLSHHDIQKRERHLAQLINRVGDHLRMVFHRFMEGMVDGRRKLHIYLCGEQLKPWDPFCRNENTRELDILSLPLTVTDRSGSETTGVVTISPFILPHEQEFSSTAAWKDAAGPRSWNQQQGFYFYRNHRLLQAGGWSWLRAVDEHTKLLRVAVQFPQKLDRAFEVNVTKMRAKIPADCRESVKGSVSRWAKVAKDRYGKTPSPRRTSGSGQIAENAAPSAAKSARKTETPPNVSYGNLSFALSNAPSHALTVAAGPGNGQVKIVIPHKHEAATLFAPIDRDNSELRRFCIAALSVLEAVYERRLKPDQIPIESLRRSLNRMK